MNRMKLADGRQIAWSETGTGRPLVLVHGWAMSCSVFSEIRDLLSDEFRVLTPDLPGHGASDPCGDYSLCALAADLSGWLAALDLSELNLVGWSLGGQVLMQLAASQKTIRRLALVSTTPCFTGRAEWSAGLPAAQVRSMARNLRRNYEKTMGDFFALQFGQDEVSRERYREIVRFAVRGRHLPDPDVALAALETLATADQRDLPAQIEARALVMHGDTDAITPPEAGIFLGRSLPSARLSMLKGVGHAPFLSRPEEVAEQWREFLQ